jgi:alcohol dehydrogenase class IV
MKRFQHVSPALRLYHGDDSLRMLARELDRVNSRRAVLFCGRSVAAERSLLGLLQDAIGARLAGIFDQVVAHSPVPAVQGGADALAGLDADAVIAVGGGSAIVTARAASVLLAEKKDVQALSTHRGPDGRLVSPRLDVPKLPQFVIPTTPTTAAVKAGSAVFDPRTKQRLAMFDPKTRAQAVFVHPAFLASSPPRLATTASLNVLAMAVEGLESTSGQPLSDADLMQSLRLLRRALPLLPERAADAAVRSDLMLAAVLCGRGADHAGGGICSVLTHAAGARFQLENGLVNAILLPHTVRFNAPATGSRLGSVAEALTGRKDALDGEEAIASLRTLLDAAAPRRLRDVGLPREALAEIAEAAFEDWFLQHNPRRVEDAEMLASLLERAW